MIRASGRSATGTITVTPAAFDDADFEAGDFETDDTVATVPGDPTAAAVQEQLTITATREPKSD